MQVGIMSGDIARPTLEETLDAILGHDIRHLQFNLGSLNVQGSLSDKLAKAPVVRAEIEKRGMVIAALAGTVNMVHPDEEKRQEAIEHLKLLIPACDPMGTSVIATCTGSRDLGEHVALNTRITIQKKPGRCYTIPWNRYCRLPKRLA